MKKAMLTSIAAIAALACTLCACGGNGGGNGDGDENVKPDKTVTAFTDADATYVLDGRTPDNARNTISDTLFGVFLEDINFAGYLLDDNLVFNGSFENINSADKKDGWKGTNANITISSTGGVLAEQQYYKDNNVNANYASVSVTKANGYIANEGHTYLKMAVEEGVKYVFSAFIKSENATEMTVSVEDSSNVYCSAIVNVEGGNKWVKYEYTLTSNGTATGGVGLRLAFEDTGTYCVDAVALETQNATGGIKQYAFDAIKALGPKFVRFPGGCIIEGNYGVGAANTQYIYDWKNSVGAVQTGTAAGADDVPEFSYPLVKDGAAETTAKTRGEWVTRKQNADLWGRLNEGYNLEYGIGFYEFFILCENLGASAVPVVNCGLADHNQGLLNGRHGNGVADYIEDAIDLIEFAKGDASEGWGKLRADMGHPEPFEMSYLGIGNEQEGSIYFETCYEKFLQNAAFKAACRKYGIKTIVGNSVAFSNCQNGEGKGVAQEAAESAVSRHIVDTVNDFGVHDQHYYVNYEKLFTNTEMYEDYAREGEDGYYEVFVGEYSANSVPVGAGDTKYPNALITALSEAAMMTAYENNGDVIKLAAYAPMFGVADVSENPRAGGSSANHWGVDMMYFTNNTIVKSANYYVQQLFMQNQGKYRLPYSDITYAEGVSKTCEVEAEDGGDPITAKTLYHVASRAENGDLIVKLVNASANNIKLNINVKNAEAQGIAYFTEVSSADGDWKATNTLKGEKVTSDTVILGFTGDTFGQEIKAYSAVCFRIKAK